MADTRMSPEEREAFLAAPRIGVLSIPRQEGPPLSAPVWYEYSPGGQLWLLTGPNSAKGKLLEEQTPVTLVAQSEELPYAYVSVECNVSALQEANEADNRHMANRYLGEEMGAAYVAANADSVSAKVTLQPRRWLSVDYAKIVAVRI